MEKERKRLAFSESYGSQEGLRIEGFGSGENREAQLQGQFRI